MVRPAQTARSERTRDALRQAALVRFLGQGVEATSAEQIAADAGVSLRTFYRHFTSKHDLLFADYDAGLQWFRAALADHPRDESLIDAVHAAVMAAPYDATAMKSIVTVVDVSARARSDMTMHAPLRTPMRRTSRPA